MKNIVFLVQKLINSGPENVVLDICRCLNRKQFTPAVISLMDEDASRSIEDKFKELDIAIKHIGASSLQEEIQTSKVAKKVREVYFELGGDLLHVHSYHPSLISAYLRDIPVVNTLHNISGEDYLIKKGRIMGSYMRWRFDRSLKNSDYCVALSDYMLNYYQGIAPRITKIPNGVSFQRNKSFDLNSFKNKHGISANQKIIVVTGTVSQRKNTIYTVRELKQSNVDFVCFIVGDGDKIEECKQITGADNRFKYEGFKSNVAEYLSAADLFVSSSLSEGLPLSVLEAINMGVPCLLSNISPHLEIVDTMDCKGVEAFELKDGHLKSKFEEIIGKDIETDTISRKAYELYSAQVMAEKYEKLYDNVLSAKL